MPIHPEVEKYLENSRRLQIPLKTLVKLVITKPVTVLKLLKSRDSLEDLTGITPEVVRYSTSLYLGRGQKFIPLKTKKYKKAFQYEFIDQRNPRSLCL